MIPGTEINAILGVHDRKCDRRFSHPSVVLDHIHSKVNVNQGQNVHG